MAGPGPGTMVCARTAKPARRPRRNQDSSRRARGCAPGGRGKCVPGRARGCVPGRAAGRAPGRCGSACQDAHEGANQDAHPEAAESACQDAQPDAEEGARAGVDGRRGRQPGPGRAMGPRRSGPPSRPCRILGLAGAARLRWPRRLRGPQIGANDPARPRVSSLCAIGCRFPPPYRTR